MKLFEEYMFEVDKREFLLKMESYEVPQVPKVFRRSVPTQQQLQSRKYGAPPVDTGLYTRTGVLSLGKTNTSKFGTPRTSPPNKPPMGGIKIGKDPRNIVNPNSSMASSLAAKKQAIYSNLGK